MEASLKIKLPIRNKDKHLRVVEGRYAFFDVDYLKTKNFRDYFESGSLIPNTCIMFDKMKEGDDYVVLSMSKEDLFKKLEVLGIMRLME